MEFDPTRMVDVWPEPAWITTDDHTLMAINSRWRDYVAHPAGPGSPPGWMEALHPDDWPKANTWWSTVSAAGAGGEIRARLRRGDGVYRQFSIKVAPLADSAGALLGWWGSATDLEGERQAQADALARQSRLEQALNAVPAIMALYAANGRIIFSNRHMLDYHGQSFEQLQRDPAGQVYHPAERTLVLDLYRRALGSGEAFSVEARLRRADGAYRWHLVQGFPLMDPQGGVDLWLGLSRDIEDVRHGEAQLAAETEVLNLVAGPADLPEVLEAVCQQVESLAPGAICSVLDAQATFGALRVAAGRRLPGRYRSALDGARISADGGPCTLAASLKAPIVTTDLGRDPRWPGSAWPDLVAEIGLRTCWSAPVLSATREVIGVLAVHRHDAVTPTAGQLESLTRFATIVGIAMAQRDRENSLSISAHAMTDARP